MDCDSLVLSIRTQENNNDLKNLEFFFDFSNLNKDLELFRNKNKEIVEKLKIENSENIWMDEFFALRSESRSFKCGSVDKNKLKRICKSQSKH